MKSKQVRFLTALPIDTCIARISKEPWVFGDELDPLWYRCDGSSDCWLLVTFRGGRFRKIRSTQYRITFSQQQTYTVATLEFQSEMWNLPSMTTQEEIDLFMGQKLDAVRMES